jgi:hypothetical protein
MNETKEAQRQAEKEERRRQIEEAQLKRKEQMEKTARYWSKVKQTTEISFEGENSLLSLRRKLSVYVSPGMDERYEKNRVENIRKIQRRKAWEIGLKTSVSEIRRFAEHSKKQNEGASDPTVQHLKFLDSVREAESASSPKKKIPSSRPEQKDIAALERKQTNNFIRKGKVSESWLKAKVYEHYKSPISSPSNKPSNQNSSPSALRVSQLYSPKREATARVEIKQNGKFNAASALAATRTSELKKMKAPSTNSNSAKPKQQENIPKKMTSLGEGIGSDSLNDSYLSDQELFSSAQKKEMDELLEYVNEKEYDTSPALTLEEGDVDEEDLEVTSPRDPPMELNELLQKEEEQTTKKSGANEKDVEDSVAAKVRLIFKRKSSLN